MNNPQHFDLLQFFHEIIENNSTTALVLIMLGAGIWIIGGNILDARHYRRLGKPAWSGLMPFAFPFKNFNTREWLIMSVLAVLSLGLLGVAVALNES